MRSDRNDTRHSRFSPAAAVSQFTAEAIHCKSGTSLYAGGSEPEVAACNSRQYIAPSTTSIHPNCTLALHIVSSLLHTYTLTRTESNQTETLRKGPLRWIRPYSSPTKAQDHLIQLPHVKTPTPLFPVRLCSPLLGIMLSRLNMTGPNPQDEDREKGHAPVFTAHWNGIAVP